MPKLSLHVFPTIHQDRPVLYNATTKKWLPSDASEDELKKHYFLSGQERDAVHAGLMKRGDRLAFCVNPTWECTLRCKHCSVLTQLVPKQAEKFDAKKFVAFVEKFIASHPYENLLYAFAGGEPLLEADEIVETIELTKVKLPQVKFRTTLTTNATLPLDGPRKRVLELLDFIVISVDGHREDHNTQRHAYKASFNPYDVTMENITNFIDLGHIDKMKVQASLPDRLLTKEYAADFMRTFLRMGITDIKVGCIHPTNVYKGTTDNYLAHFKTQGMRNTPCCKFRFGSVYNIDASGKISDAFWEWAGNVLGTWEDAPESIVAAQARNITNEFPCLQDAKCMSCPVIGHCWGGCVNGITVLGNKPSLYCGQQRIIDKVKELAEAGTLIG